MKNHKSTINLYGAGGHAKVIIDILRETAKDIVVYDDDKTLSELLNFPIIHDRIDNPIIISIGSNTIRKKVVGKLEDAIYTSAISERTTLSQNVEVGEGTVVMQGCVIQSSTTIGNHVIVNTGSTIDHDCIIEDFVHIAPGCNLCGAVEIAEGTLIGAGSVIIPGVKIGKWSVIGAGSVVVNDIPDNVTAVGNPCRVIKRR